MLSVIYFNWFTFTEINIKKTAHIHINLKEIIKSNHQKQPSTPCPQFLYFLQMLFEYI
jgi:hypothetical protein